ncbi:MAG: uncharacterized protein KVP18_000367 [Porospora cf. gigantea A]|uniref:uncharacterized protein n=1 Tax=Porospora cf. gigantea A TaxID=2853593 RepID=UPI003559CB42|nr:MAG: hypothetical protein KVP18_000367 [Porospora cf. gigantea A]
MVDVNETVIPKWGHLEYKWRIDNFWELRALGSIEALEDDGGDVIWSKRFGDKEKGFWRLKCYPYGDLSNRGHVSIFLASDVHEVDPPRMYAIFGCYVMDEKGEKIQGSGRSFTRQKFTSSSPSWGWSQFIKVESHSLSRMLQNNSNLVLRVDIEVFLGLQSTRGNLLPTPKSFPQQVMSFADSRRDVRFLFGGRQFEANSFVCSARSKVLATLLGSAPSLLSIEDKRAAVEYTSFDATPSTTSTKISSAKAVDVSDICKFVEYADGTTVLSFDPAYQADTVQAFVEFIATDECSYFTPEEKAAAAGSSTTAMIELFVLAHKMEATPLYWQCAANLMTRLVNRRDAQAILKIAEEVQCEILEDQCKKFMLHCLKDLDGDDLLRVILPKSAHVTLAGRLG